MSAQSFIGPNAVFSVAPSVGQSAGVATIALNTTSIAVADPKITANSVVVCSPAVAFDTTALRFVVSLTAGTGFTITTNQAATAATPVFYFVAKY